ncbi:phosphatidate cytidylyltransferase, partial [Pseudomonas syringae]|uniref:phosphatidate cytidylyltransferase n=2 Tax=Gammaproteobacteria TaxID=1236 RepID=UPI0034D57802
SDVFQYICGKIFGKHKLAPILSPSKTLEGLIGGIGLALTVGVLTRGLTPFTLFQSLWISLTICLFGFLGGLVMSAIKRDRGVKDWGDTIQG